MYICTQLIPLAIKQPFHESVTGLVGTDLSNSFSEICLDGNCSLMIGSLLIFIDLVITSHISLELYLPGYLENRVYFHMVFFRS